MTKILDIANAWQHNHAVIKAPQAAKTNGPRIMVRFRSEQELRAVQEAARSLNLSVNTYTAEVLSRAAQELLGQESKSATVHTAETHLQASSF